ncbi:hypothetical protein CENSYa_1132 [Cenarchaeum symbiosum A]|uniref:Uncharacterized protein n=1 Tax=Cenarchaeum symbiosum (strain A) TaxID=414004 RepID=A0RWP3_CENSY|nr:hypothetical protein CENSYa_1132 [Cenarchaeum symbiosum A]
MAAFTVPVFCYCALHSRNHAIHSANTSIRPGYFLAGGYGADRQRAQLLKELVRYLNQ